MHFSVVSIARGGVEGLGKQFSQPFIAV